MYIYLSVIQAGLLRLSVREEVAKPHLHTCTHIYIYTHTYTHTRIIGKNMKEGAKQTSIRAQIRDGDIFQGAGRQREEEDDDDG
jgi:hypothetical protein